MTPKILYINEISHYQVRHLIDCLISLGGNVSSIGASAAATLSHELLQISLQIVEAHAAAYAITKPCEKVMLRARPGPDRLNVQ